MSEQTARAALRGDALAYHGQLNRAVNEVELLINSPGVPEDMKALSLNDLHRIRTRFRDWLKAKSA